MNASSLIRAAPTTLCHPWPRHVMTVESWIAMAEALGEEPTLELLAFWADTLQVHALFRDTMDENFLMASVDVEARHYAALSPHRPAAAWFERMIHDLWGHHASGGRDGRPWLDHGRWGQTAPMSPRPVRCPARPIRRNFCRSRARIFTRSPSVPCMPALSNLGIFASPHRVRR